MIESEHRQQKSLDWKAHLSKAKECFARGEYQEAIELLQECRQYARERFPEVDGRTLEILRPLAAILDSVGEDRQAFEVYQQALDIHRRSNSTDAVVATAFHMQFVESCMRLGYYEEATKVLDEFSQEKTHEKSTPKLANSLMRSLLAIAGGNEKAVHQHIQQAIIEYNRMPSSEKEFALVLINKTSVDFYRMGRPRDFVALADFLTQEDERLATQTIKQMNDFFKDITPGSFIFQLRLAQSLNDIDQPQRALNAIKPFIDDPESLTSKERIQLGQVLSSTQSMLGDSFPADEFLRNNIQRKQESLNAKSGPELAEELIELVEFLYRESRFREAGDYLKHLERLPSDDLTPEQRKRAVLAKGITTFAIESAEQALPIFEQARKSGGDDYSLQDLNLSIDYYIARCRYTSGDRDGASELLDSLITNLYPTGPFRPSWIYPQVLMFSAEIAQGDSDFERSMSLLLRAGECQARYSSQGREETKAQLDLAFGEHFRAQGDLVTSQEYVQKAEKRLVKLATPSLFILSKLYRLSHDNAHATGNDSVAADMERKEKALKRDLNLKNDGFLFGDDGL